jgi:hypothetical protein
VGENFSGRQALEQILKAITHRDVTLGSTPYSEFEELTKGLNFNLAIEVAANVNTEASEVKDFSGIVRHWLQHEGKKTIILMRNVMNVPTEMTISTGFIRGGKK